MLMPPHQGRAAADVAGDGNPFQPLQPRQVVCQRLGARQGRAERHTVPIPLTGRQVAAHSGERGGIQGGAVGAVELRQPVQGGDVMLLRQGADLLRGQAGKAQQRRQALGNRALQVVVIAEPAAGQEFPDFTRQCLADSRYVFKAAAPLDGLQALFEAQKLPRGAPVGADAKRVVALQFQQIGDVVKDGADVVLIHRIIHLLSSSRRRCQKATTVADDQQGRRRQAGSRHRVADPGQRRREQRLARVGQPGDAQGGGGARHAARHQGVRDAVRVLERHVEHQGLGRR